LLLFLGLDYRGYLMSTVTIEEMNKLNIWLRWALCVFGLGLMISLSTTALVKATIAGWIMLSPAMWWGVMVGLVLSWLCPVAGIVLAVRGLIMLVKSVRGIKRE
jgi:hypothetical protein